MAGERSEASVESPGWSPDDVMGDRTAYEDGEDDWHRDSPEAWVVGRSLYGRGEDDPPPAGPPLTEPEDWDAEIQENQDPYDAEDVDGVCEQQCSTADYQWGSEESYEPSAHHAPSIAWSRGVSSADYIQAGQFEDAEQ